MACFGLAFATNWEAIPDPRARPVVDDHLLAERVAHLLRDRPRRDVAYAARAERYQHADRLRRIALRRRGRGQKLTSAGKSFTAKDAESAKGGGQPHRQGHKARLEDESNFFFSRPRPLGTPPEGHNIKV